MRAVEVRREAVVVEGEVVALLPRALVEVAIGPGRVVVAHAAPAPARNFVRVLVGDRVRVELSPRDPGRGRIVERLTGR